MDRRVHVYGKAKQGLTCGAVAKASLKRATISRARAARNPVIYPWPG